MKYRLLRYVAFVGLGAAYAAASAAPPELKGFSPPGASRGATTEISVVGDVKAWPVRAWVSGGGVRLEAGKEKGKFSVVVEADAAPGPRWVRLVNDEGASAVRPLIISSLKETPEKETNDSDAQAQDLGAEPVVVNGALAKSGDIDAFRVSLKAGQTFTASLEANERLGAPVDAVLQIAREGFVVAQNHDDRGLDPRLAFVVPRDGDYIVRVFGFPSDPNSTIGYHGSAECVYRLTLTTGPAVDFAFPLTTATDKSTTLGLRGWNLPAAAATPIAAASESGRRALALPSGYAGDAFVDTVEVAALDEREPNDRGVPQKISLPCVVSGVIGRAGDRDAFQFSGKKGESWRIRVRSKSLGFPVDPVAIVLGPDGKQLLRSDDVGRGETDVDAALKIAVDGPHTIVVEDLFGAGSERNAYVLDVRSADADFALTVAAAEFTVAAGKPLEIPVTVERPAGMTGEIEVRIEGLPKEFPEVKAVSAGKGDTAKKATLKFTPPKAFSGPIRIVGAVKSPTAIRRTAEFTIANIPRAKIADLWLTATAAKK